MGLDEKGPEHSFVPLACLGVPETQVEAAGLGMEKSVVQRTDEMPPAKNRRIELSYR